MSVILIESKVKDRNKGEMKDMLKRSKLQQHAHVDRIKPTSDGLA
jgi:hypothetical protein